MLYMSDYYLFRKYGVNALSHKRVLSRKNYSKAMASSRMYRIFVTLATLMTSSNFQILNLQFLYLHCVELLWKNQVSIINNSKVFFYLHFEYFSVFPFWANFEDFSVNHLSMKNRKKKFHIYIKLKFSQNAWD